MNSKVVLLVQMIFAIQAQQSMASADALKFRAYLNSNCQGIKQEAAEFKTMPTEIYGSICGETKCQDNCGSSLSDDFSMAMVCTSDGLNITWYKKSADCSATTKIGSYTVNATELTKLKAGNCAAATYDGSIYSPNRYVMLTQTQTHTTQIYSTACEAPAPAPTPSSSPGSGGNSTGGNSSNGTTTAPKASTSKSGFSPSLSPALAMVALGAAVLSY